MQLEELDRNSSLASHLVVDSELKLSSFFAALVQKGSLENVKIVSKDVQFFYKGVQIGINQDFSTYITSGSDVPQLGWSSAMVDVCCTFSKIRDGLDGILPKMRDLSLISVTFCCRNSKKREVDAGEGFDKEVPELKRDGVLFELESMFKNHGFEFTMTPFRWELHKHMTHVIYRLSRSAIAHQTSGAKWLRHVEPYSFNGTIFDFFQSNLKKRLSKSQYDILSERLFPSVREYLLSSEVVPVEVQSKVMPQKKQSFKRQKLATHTTVDTGEDIVSGRIYEMMFMTDANDTRERSIVKINSIQGVKFYFMYLGKDSKEYVVTDDEVKFFSYVGNIVKEKYQKGEIVFSRYDEGNHETWFYATVTDVLPKNTYQVVYNGYESYDPYIVKWDHLKKIK